MGILSNIVDNGSSNQYAELTDADLKATNTDNQIAFVDVTGQDDLVNAKEALNRGTTVILDIAFIESNGLSLNIVYGEIQSTTDNIGGDIVHKENNDIIVATPRDIGINRQKI